MTEQQVRRPAPVPHDTGDEAALLGAALLLQHAARAVATRTAPADYYDLYHRRVRDAIARLVETHEPVELRTVASDLARRNGVESLDTAKQRLGELLRACGAAANWPSYLRSVHDWTYRRRLQAAAADLRLAAEHGAPDEITVARTALFNVAAPGQNTLRRWTMDELLVADRSFSWLAQGLLVQPTYGMLGGPRKTLKTYMALFIALGIAAGEPVFGQFAVPGGPRPVVLYVGEGGRVPMTRRLERVAQAIGVNLADIPLYPHFDIAPLNSPTFQETLRSDLEELDPALIIIDPLYSFHPSDVKASSLYEEGALLANLSTPCANAGCSLLIGNHFNKTGTGSGLDRITQAGGQEWSDTWMLLSHRRKPDVEEGRFQLLLDIGSRQWGGGNWDVDLTIGQFDVDRAEFDGPITWVIRRHVDDEPADNATVTADILDILSDEPWQFTKTQVRGLLGGKTTRFNDAWDELRAANVIKADRAYRIEGGKKRGRDVWAPAGTAPPEQDLVQLDLEGA